mgnify:CR=1 FL=1
MPKTPREKLMFRLRRFILFLYAFLYRPLRYRTVYFFDTNFFLDLKVLPRYRLTLSRRFFITENVWEELQAKLPKNRLEKIRRRYKILTFNNIYNQDQNVCPTYYNFISELYNPANVGSEDFFEELYGSRRIKGEQLSDIERKLYEIYRRESGGSQETETDKELKKKILESDSYRFLKKSHSKTLKKAKEAQKDKHPAYLRDVKSFALILYYALTARENVVYFTADSDAVTFKIRWLDSLSMRMCLTDAIYPQLNDQNKKEMLKGKILEFFIPYTDFVKRRETMFSNLLMTWWKKDGHSFKIKFWDKAERKYRVHEIIFNKLMAHVVSHAHGPLSCHFTRNDTLGNWFHMQYFWPPRDPKERRIKVEVSAKKIINKNFRPVPAIIHDTNCRYRIEDREGTISSWTSFTLITK